MSNNGNGNNDLGSGDGSSKAPVKEEPVILATSPQSDDVFVPLLGSRRSLFPRAEDVDELRANVEEEAKGFWTEFKKFIERGPIVDLAVGSVAGVLFNQLITSFANEILMPPLGLLAGSSFRNFFIVIKKGSSGRKDYVTAADARSDGAIILGLGLFLQTLIDFIISMLFLFFALKLGQRLVYDIPRKEGKIELDVTCRDCLSSIPAKANRCKFCTSYVKTRSG